jgi:tRNA (pseudouridine54-N1)-methyltransferase
MRQFVVLGHDAPTDADFSLDDLAGGAGRLDLLSRCVTAALLRSHGVREDVRVHLVLDDSVTISFRGEDVRRLNPDERSTAALIRQALQRRRDAVGHQPVETAPGVSLTRLGLEATLGRIADDGGILMLDAEGTPVSSVTPPADPVFVLSDHRDFTNAEDALLSGLVTGRISLGPVAIHADQAITVAHNWVDTDGFSR